MGFEDITLRRIVVGVDGSPSSKSALRWAVKLAQSSGSVVDAVIAWEVPAFYGVVTPPMLVDFWATANDVLTQAVKDTLGDKPEGVEVREHVMVGNTAQVLLNAAADADLLVVGNHGHGGFARALLGSVSQHCVHHAPCPVLVVRGSEGAERDD
jgi:nucleotide-binding universal stress UspA family protein